MNIFRSQLSSIPPVTKNLLIINILMFLAQQVLPRIGIDITNNLSLYYFGSEQFMPFQLITHMFLHGNITHLFFNMFALWMFGKAVESTWGSKRFFIYYFVTGLGAALMYTLVNYIQLTSIVNEIPYDLLNTIKIEGNDILSRGMNYTDPIAGKVNVILNVPVLGASGAVFGILLAFGMLFPNTRLMLLFPPIPIKAKYFVIGYGLIELFGGVMQQPGDNVAHFAHLGGMIFGFIFIKIWDKNKFNRID